MVSRPELGSDPPIRSGQESGQDIKALNKTNFDAHECALIPLLGFDGATLTKAAEYFMKNPPKNHL